MVGLRVKDVIYAGRSVEGVPMATRHNRRDVSGIGLAVHPACGVVALPSHLIVHRRWIGCRLLTVC